MHDGSSRGHLQVKGPDILPLEKLRTENTALKEKNVALQNEIAALKEQNNSTHFALQNENIALAEQNKSENLALQTEIAALKEQNKSENVVLQTENAAPKERNAALRTDNSAMKLKIGVLEVESRTHPRNQQVGFCLNLLENCIASFHSFASSFSYFLGLIL